MGCAASCTKQPWKDFRTHPLLAKYRVHKKLGAGAFSEVCSPTAVHVLAKSFSHGYSFFIFTESPTEMGCKVEVDYCSVVVVAVRLSNSPHVKAGLEGYQAGHQGDGGVESRLLGQPINQRAS